MSGSPTIFILQSRKLQGRRFDSEYHHALLNIRIKSPYPLVKLFSLATFKTGGTPSTDNEKYWGGTLPWVSAKDFKNFRFEDAEDHITELAAQEATTYVVNKPAVLMVSRSGILQHSLPVMVTHKRTAINQDIKAFFPDKRVSADYLGAFFDLSGKRLLPLLCKSGATVQSLNTNELLNLPIPVPPHEVQKQIVAELDAAYEAKRNADEKATHLLASIDEVIFSELGIPPLPPQDTSLAARTFIVPNYELFGKRFDAYYYQSGFRKVFEIIASDNRRVLLGQIGDFIRGVTYSSSDENENGLAILRANNVSLDTGELDLSELVHVRDDMAFDESQHIRPGDILICAASGSKEHAGKVAFVDTPIKNAFAGGFMTILRVDKSVVLPRYIAVFMQSSLFRSLIMRYLGGTNINNVSVGMLTRLPVIIPSNSIQQLIVERVERIREEAKHIMKCAANTLESVKNKIEVELIGT